MIVELAEDRPSVRSIDLESNLIIYISIGELFSFIPFPFFIFFASTSKKCLSNYNSKGSFHQVSPSEFSTVEDHPKPQLPTQTHQRQEEIHFTSKWFARTRFIIVRHLSCPLPIPRSFPSIGGKSFLELIIMAGGVLACYFHHWGQRRFSSVASAVGLIIVALAMRNNILLSMIGIFEIALFWHKFLAIIIWALIIMHGIAHSLPNNGGMQGNATARRLDGGGDDDGGGIGGDEFISGMILSVAIFMMGPIYLLSWIKYFNSFYFLQISFFILIVIFSFLHGATAFGIGIFVWGADLLIRYGIRHQSMEGNIIIQSNEIIKIILPNNIHRKLTFSSGQYCFLRVRALNHYEYHPLSISSGIGEEWE
jgi:hypothetical protein